MDRAPSLPFPPQIALQAMLKRYREVVYTERFSPFPILLTPDRVSELHRLQEILLRLVSRSIPADGAALGGIDFLPQKIKRVIRRAPRPYRIGSLRTDFLFTLSRAVRICEINARFPTNAFVMTDLLNEALFGTDSPRSAAGPPHDEVSPVSLLAGEKKLVILKGEERGYDIHVLAEQARRRGQEVLWLSPADLARRSAGNLRALWAGARVILELHQHEILSLSEEHLEALHCSDYFNDLRTVFCVHDKRFLGLLCDREFLRGRLGPEDGAFLAERIAGTFFPARPECRAAALAARQKWLLKPNLLGKGSGLLFGGDCSQRAWTEALDDPSHRDFVLQEVIEQPQFWLDPSGENGPQPMFLVGTLMSFDQQALGPGFFRASTSRITNIADGGWAMGAGALIGNRMSRIRGDSVERAEVEREAGHV